MAVYGVLGDIHGNREALEAVLATLDARGFDRLVCVGDLVGYNADPDECVRLLRARDAICIAGNHDLIGTGRLGFERCSNKAMHSLKRTRVSLAPETARFLCSLPSHVRLEPDVLLFHGGIRDVQQYMTQPRHILENVRYLREDFPGVRVGFYGHTHEQRVFSIDGEDVSQLLDAGTTQTVELRRGREHFINPGSVDASRKRDSKLAECAVFDSAARTVAFHRVPYDEATTESKAEANGYRIDRWHDRLYDMRRLLLGRA